jgi:death-on-curing protein
MKNVQYLILDELLAIHYEMVERYGGSHGIRDLGLIQAALGRPQASFAGEDLYPTILDKAASLFHSLMFNHAFVDGNKRTTMTATARFLFVNGYNLIVDQEEFVFFPLRVANNHMAIEVIAAWLQDHSKKR